MAAVGLINGGARESGGDMIMGLRNRRLLWQLYPSLLLVALAALLAAFWLAGSAVKSFYLQQVEADLEARGALLQAKVAELVTAGREAGLQDYCLEAGAASATRLTVIAPDGRVLADSAEPPAAMENHAGRFEVAAALAGERASAVRLSRSTGEDTMYRALPLVREGTVIGVLRTALPLTAIDRALAEILRRLAAGGLLIALAVALVAWLVARRLSRPLEEMRAGADRFADGSFEGKISEEGAEELAGLARAMNRMAAQLALRLHTIECQRTQLQAVVGSMVEGVITVDGGGRLLDLNRAASELLDLRLEQVRGRSIEVAIRNSGLNKLIRRTLAVTEPVEGEFTLLDGRGQERFCTARGNRLQLEEAVTPGAVLVISDLTRLRRLENLRRDFVANVSHELKTPITSIEGFAETLLDGALAEPEQARRFATIILEQARRLHAIVEDLLSLSRIEQEGRRREVPLQNLPLLETLRAAVAVCAERAAVKKMPLTVEGPEALRAWINPALLEQALVNLIDNAIKYGKAGGEITVSAATAAGEILIGVRDRGPGIPPEALSRIFERFYRVDKARSTSLGGTGLGLAIVKHIAQVHHGRIEVSSRPEEGTIFTIHLPATPPPPGPAAAAVEAESADETSF